MMVLWSARTWKSRAPTCGDAESTTMAGEAPKRIQNRASSVGPSRNGLASRRPTTQSEYSIKYDKAPHRRAQRLRSGRPPDARAPVV